MEQTKNIKNALMKRHEVSYIVDAEKNPSFPEMTKQISSEMKKPEENINVYSIQGKFGRDTFLVKAYVYDSKEDLAVIKNLCKTKKMRTTEKEEAKKAKEEAKKAKEEAAKPKEEKKAEEAPAA
jgi:ribosomal protein S24E